MLPRIGIAGCGWIGRKRIEALIAGGHVAVVAIADPDRLALDEMRQLAPNACFTTNFGELLTLKLDGIVIATPSAIHADQATLALKHGSAVFCEKPLGCSASDTQRVVNLAQRVNRNITVDFCYRYLDAVEKARSLIKSGELGRVYAIELSFHNAYGPDKSWYYDRASSGGGCLIDLGIHLVDLMFWMIGFQPVTSIKGHLYGHARPRRVNDEVEDHALASIVLSNKTVAHLNCSWARPRGKDAAFNAVFYGNKGTVEIANVNGSFYDFSSAFYRERTTQQLSSPPDDWGGRCVNAWARNLRESCAYDRAAEDYVYSAQIIEALYRRSSGHVRS